jgi:2-hydroxy-6-oxonona-2,4-dienedioate hydrolase
MENQHVKVEGRFKYYEAGKEDGEVLLLLHGLMGALSNFEGIISHFSKTHRVILPFLPIFEMPITRLSVSGLVEHVADFVEHKGFEKVNPLGNSLGGHLAILYALARPEQISRLILTGSSGLFESAMGTSFPKRSNYEYIKQKTADTFYDPEFASKELVDEIFEMVSDRNKAIRIVITAKSAMRHNLGDNLHQLDVPTLLIWGRQDKVTPPFVGEKFHELIEGSELVFLDQCGHAPMMERPAEFILALEAFLRKT